MYKIILITVAVGLITYLLMAFIFNLGAIYGTATQRLADSKESPVTNYVLPCGTNIKQL